MIVNNADVKINKKKRIMSVKKALSILIAFKELETEELGLSELSSYLNIPKSTLSFLMNTLEEDGFIRKTEPGKYCLGLKLFELGNLVGQQLDLRKRSLPHLRSIVDILGETVHLAILNQDQAFYIEKVEGKYTTSIPSQVGRHNPLHCTGVGKVLLAHLEQSEINRIIKQKGLNRLTKNTICDAKSLFAELKKIRSQGYALDNEEFEKGLLCFAAPIRNHKGLVVAAISISGHANSIDLKSQDNYISLIKKTAINISEAYGYQEL